MTTTTIFGNTSDGDIFATSVTTYAVAREGTGSVTADDSAAQVRVGQFNQTSGSPNFRCHEAFVAFATALIPDGDTITSATFSIFTAATINQNGPDFDMEARVDTYQPTLTAGDYVAGSALGARTLLASLNTSVIIPSTRFDFSENGSNLRDHINVTGDTEFLICSSRQRLNQPPPDDTVNEVAFFAADDVGTSRDPRLVIVHSSPPGPPSGPFPVVESRITSESNGTSHTVTMPSGVVTGDMLIVAFGTDIGTVTFPGGWTQLENHITTLSTRFAVYFRESDGTEGASIIVTTSASRRAAHLAYRISGVEDPTTQAPESALADNGAGTDDNPNPPNLIPNGGAKNYLWLVPFTQFDNIQINSFPTNYSNGLEERTLNNLVGSAERQLNASSENPGVYTTGDPGNWVATTVVLHPGPGATIALTGTITDDNELDIRNGGSTIILTVTNDTWVAAGGTFDAQRQNIIDGLDSAGAEADGWDAVARPAIPVGNVVRTSNTIVTITIPVAGIPGYNITATEIITATVPASALSGGVETVADPPFAISFLNEIAVVSGTVIGDDESDIRAGGSTIILTLTNAQWEANVGADNPQTQALIDGIDSAQSEANGWDAVVKAGLTFGNVARTSDFIVTITLPAFPGYSITADETITAIVPASALEFPNALTASPTFNISDLPGAPGGSVGMQQRELLLL